MSFFKKNKICVTHNGGFHTDDLFATAVLFILNNGNIKIIRTRDKDTMKKGDYVYDVGGVYDERKNLFDHHQKGGAGKRENGIPYSSFGLIWEKYGKKLCGNKDIADMVDKKIVQPIDAVDNGVDIITLIFDGVSPYSVQDIFMVNYPTWKENILNIDNIFEKEVKKIVKILTREIKIAKDDFVGKQIVVDSYNNSENKKIVIINEPLPRYLIQDILPKFSEPIYFIYPSGHSDAWKVEAVRKDLTTYESRKLFPESWRGFMNGDISLRKLTGISDIVFCHQSGFFLVVKSKKGAIKLAEEALLA